ncbi:hypothetical protein [Alteromonas lipolytica]|uniref:RecA/RadA recombinase n=1 Tax=Alteromonas lipolytica TaxID=1856405 RepID=A0A1E8FHL5_9ALTE|nr:hypothetical protein [Alteromonas lipolytica]OFI35394.1 hypothetical protein BFC17_11515 [Alteromonas lipolytica]GGF75943.1 hypothetical protein GCM10011338_30050 [Alteromonas lipolytica]
MLRLPFGQQKLDEACVGGVPAAGVITLRALPGSSEIQLMHNVMQQKAATQKRILWLHNDWQLNHNWLIQSPLHKQSWVVTTRCTEDSLWAGEQAIRSQACCCVVLYISQLAAKAARRLQVLACQYDCLVIVVQHAWGNHGVLPVNIDMQLTFSASEWLVQLNRVKGAWPQTDIPITHPLPASNDAIVKAFSHFSHGQTSTLHEVS